MSWVHPGQSAVDQRDPDDFPGYWVYLPLELESGKRLTEEYSGHRYTVCYPNRELLLDDFDDEVDFDSMWGETVLRLIPAEVGVRWRPDLYRQDVLVRWPVSPQY